MKLIYNYFHIVLKLELLRVWCDEAALVLLLSEGPSFCQR